MRNVHAVRRIAMLAVLSSAAVFANANEAIAITLNDNCPAGFEWVEGNRCELRSLYQQYPSIQSQGVGGLKTGLPTYRDGFSPQAIDLGRYLFFDPVLSVNGQQSCATCHDPKKGFADGRALAVGALGVIGKRSAPSLWNVAFQERFFWDGRANSLEEQMTGPLYSLDEMANTPAQLLATLNGLPVYRALFYQAFGEQGNITLEQIYHALAAFQASLVSLNSRYDQYAHGYAQALTEPEIEGLNVFRSFVARCAECHTPPLFTNQQIAVIGTPELDGMPRDLGAQGPTGDPSLRGGFKVPSLRNIELTAPYMHSGKFETLWSVSEFYTLGRGHALEKDEPMYLHWHIWEPQLTDAEIDRLVDFMATLTDIKFTPAIPTQLPSGLMHISADDFDQRQP